MKFKLLFALGLCFPASFSASALAFNQITENYIPKWYAQITLEGADPGGELDKNGILKIFIEACAKANVNTCDLAVYDAGKQKGEGVRASGQIVKDKKGLRLSKFEEMTTENQSLAGESWLGYTIEPKQLSQIHQAYTKNPRQAATRYGGKIYFINLSGIEGFSRGSRGNAYLALPLDRNLSSGVIFSVPADDPLLGKAVKGTNISFRCTPGTLAKKFLGMNCSLIMAGTLLKAGPEIIDLSQQN